MLQLTAKVCLIGSDKVGFSSSVEVEMKASCSIGGRPQKGDTRTMWNWVGKLSMEATSDGDQFVLAAIYRAMFGNEDDAKALRKAIKRMACAAFN